MAGFLFSIIVGIGGLAYGIHLGAEYKSFDGVVKAFNRFFKN